MADDEKLDDLEDERAARRERKKKIPMPVDGAFLREIPRIQKSRAEKLTQQTKKKK